MQTCISPGMFLLVTSGTVCVGIVTLHVRDAAVHLYLILSAQSKDDGVPRVRGLASVVRMFVSRVLYGRYFGWGPKVLHEFRGRSFTSG